MRPERPLFSDARELLRLIDRDPSLAECIRDLAYSDPDFICLPLKDKYSPEELKHDHKNFSQFAEELAQKSLIQKKFGYFFQSWSSNVFVQMKLHHYPLSPPSSSPQFLHTDFFLH